MPYTHSNTPTHRLYACIRHRVYYEYRFHTGSQLSWENRVDLIARSANLNGWARYEGEALLPDEDVIKTSRSLAKWTWTNLKRICDVDRDQAMQGHADGKTWAEVAKSMGMTKDELQYLLFGVYKLPNTGQWGHVPADYRRDNYVPDSFFQ